MASTWTDEGGEAYLETVALLQEEIARLEAELRQRDEAAPAWASAGPEAPASDPAEGRIGELTSLLAERDETIGLLWDQLTALEEVGSAKAAEWDQLTRWVEELEERIERDGTPPVDPSGAEAEAAALRDRLESQQRSWDAERLRYQRELETLRARRDEAGRPADVADPSALLEENRRLSEQCDRVEALETEVSSLRDQIRGLKASQDDERRELVQVANELRRELIEREQELALLRIKKATSRDEGDAEASPDERIRAFRQHLRDLHEKEEQERAERQLSTRLGRLWHRVGARR